MAIRRIQERAIKMHEASRIVVVPVDGAMNDWMLDELGKRGDEIDFLRARLIQFTNNNRILRRQNERLAGEPEGLKQEVKRLKQALNLAHASLAPVAAFARHVQDEDLETAISAEQDVNGEWHMLYVGDLLRVLETYEKLWEL